LLIGFAGCGEDSRTSSVSASLLIPRALVDDLESVVIYLFEVRHGEPNCDKLTTDFATYENDAFRKVTIDFRTIQVTVIDDIPNRGRVWKFYARGFDAASQPIAQGCDSGLYEVTPGSEVPISITIEPML
ncbi:MAG: hypothetical protein JRJ19_04715, partial [Deltaproteobacteria bacterium]|nr:hypothetical protein [Deltaproteobacteria bacterium]